MILEETTLIDAPPEGENLKKWAVYGITFVDGIL
jgi:hypothetical protein